MIPCRGSHTVVGEEVPQKLKGWLSPSDPSTNYNIGLRDLHEDTATWFLEGDLFQEWHSAGTLLWIHGKRTFLETCRYLSLTALVIHSRFGEERPLVRYIYSISLYGLQVNVLEQLCDHQAYPITVRWRKSRCGIFLLRFPGRQ